MDEKVTRGTLTADPDVVVQRAHPDVGGFVGGGLRSRDEREAALDLALAPGATRALGAGHRGKTRGARPVPALLRA